jgi:hypothetical protein
MLGVVSGRLSPGGGRDLEEGEDVKGCNVDIGFLFLSKLQLVNLVTVPRDQI